MESATPFPPRPGADSSRPLGTENTPLTPSQQTAFDAEPEIKVISFRRQNHLFPLSATLSRAPDSLYAAHPGSPASMHVDRSPAPGSETLLHQLARFTFCFVTVHNICFGFVLLSLSALLWSFLPFMLPRAAVLAAWAWYVAKLSDISAGRDCKRASIWPWLQSHWGWNYTHEWGYMEVARLAKLDPKRQYFFGVYPHGILIHSRLTMWGGIFQQLFPGLQIPRIFAASMLFSIPGSRELCLVRAQHVSADM